MLLHNGHSQLFYYYFSLKKRLTGAKLERHEKHVMVKESQCSAIGRVTCVAACLTLVVLWCPWPCVGCVTWNQFNFTFQADPEKNVRGPTDERLIINLSLSITMIFIFFLTWTTVLAKARAGVSPRWCSQLQESQSLRYTFTRILFSGDSGCCIFWQLTRVAGPKMVTSV